jgi:hypothetical protein
MCNWNPATFVLDRRKFWPPRATPSSWNLCDPRNENIVIGQIDHLSAPKLLPARGFREMPNFSKVDPRDFDPALSASNCPAFRSAPQTDRLLSVSARRTEAN